MGVLVAALPLLAALSLLPSAGADHRTALQSHPPYSRAGWPRQPRDDDLTTPRPFVGPHVCRSRNRTHCCPGWTARPNSLLCVVPVCARNCGGPGTCVAPNLCRCQGGFEGPSCSPNAQQAFEVGRPRGGCKRICMNGGTCTEGHCSCAPGWTGEFCVEPICKEPCLHGGRCIAPDRCVCFHGLSGKRCEIDRRTGPCYTEVRGSLCTGALEGVVCTKQLCCATVGRAWGHPCEKCGTLDCPAGHLRNLQTRDCQDIDECAAVPGLCSGGRCINSVGSFSCECPLGQRRDHVSNNCEDINECEDENICQNGKCVNTDGDYYCMCNPHFIPSPDKKYCIDGRVGNCFAFLSETGECQDSLPHQLSNRDCCCGQNMGQAWGDYCTPCPERKSLEWSRLCGGMRRVPSDFPRSQFGNHTGGRGGNGINGGSGGNEEASNIGTGIDGSGPGGEDYGTGNGVDDQVPTFRVNECRLRENICGLGVCEDKPIGYECKCPEGTEQVTLNGGPTCIDINECVLGFCAGGKCTNLPGGVQCECPEGFDVSADGRRCTDTDECGISGMCAHGTCINVNGGFRCNCLPGFELSAAGRSCRDIDECRDNPGICRFGRCENTPGAYRCLCNPGFVPTDAGYCRDDNECDVPGTCERGRCINTEGSFQCLCDPGYELGADRATCRDVNECRDQLDVCRNGHCENTPGSFRCQCRKGFNLSPDGRSCLDDVKDLCYYKFESGECREPGEHAVTRSTCCCSAGKEEHLGWGVSCSACPAFGSKEWYELCPHHEGKDNDGRDINECTQRPGVCAHGACENLDPGYRCMCDPGYHADHEGHVCHDINECEMQQSLCQGGQCRNTPGNFSCVCPDGTTYEPDTQICADINECNDSENACINGRCINKHQGYECECEPGFVLDVSGRHCLDNRRGSCWQRVVDGRCEAVAPRGLLRQECCCSIGVGWGSPCLPCDDHICPCKKGYAKLDGVTCRDIDECSLSLGLCGGGGSCVNTDGSYSCVCPPGLSLEADGTTCVDVRHEQCYMEYSHGQCSQPISGASLRSHCCCSPAGKAWGSTRCEACPKKGTDAHNDLCFTGVNGGERGDIPFGTNGPFEDPFGPNGHGGHGGGEFGHNGHGGHGGGEFGHNGNGGHGGDEFGPNGWNPGNQVLDTGMMDVNECAEFPGLCAHGRCRNTPGSFECRCNPGYEIDESRHTCVDVDECSIVAGVCGAGECINTEGGFTCHCHSGYRTNNLLRVCVDINECEEMVGLCHGGECVNTAGSFHCECGRGLELAPDRLSCKDIDECSRTSGICSNGVCENLMGTYQCVCNDGYLQSRVKSHCEDVDECVDDNGNCDHECVNAPGSYHCECREGWSLRGDGRSCMDVDECAVGVRVCGGGECRNTIGSYACTCGEGLLSAPDKPGCLDVDECETQPGLCGAGQCSNTVGSFVCRCDDGYSVKPDEGPACTDDDECALETCNCHPAADCINLPGSFQCRCRDGWTGDGLECNDVDECLANNGGCHPRATCRNTDGSFVCICDTGFKGDGYSCVDIDECANDPALCENGSCKNTAGSYECDCDMGFMPAEDGHICTDINECTTFDNLCVFGRCQNTFGTFECVCDKGYQPDRMMDNSPGGNCTDVDECLSPQSCLYGECINAPGSYRCRCPPNYDLVSDGNACFDTRQSRCFSNVDLRSGREHCSDHLSDDGSMSACCCSVGTAWGGHCDRCPDPNSEEFKQLCPGGVGYQPVLEPPGYIVTLADIDECEAHPKLCENGQCTNTFGSFVCSCFAGWRLSANGLKCEDVDECLESPGICGAGMCRNLDGSHMCICPEGYATMPDRKECVDVRQRQCYTEWSNGVCDHTMGAPQTRIVCCCSLGRAWGEPCEPCPESGTIEYRSLCGGAPPGEIHNPMTNTTEQIDECSLMSSLCGHGHCIDTPGSFECVCNHGYVYDPTSHQCRDDNECARTPSPCNGIARCVNLPGSFECRCPVGYKPSPSMLDCEDADECSGPGTCEHGTCRNTVGSYQCTCAPGYTLIDNSCTDVDECTRQRNMCRNGTCKNLPGSYTCACDEGFKLSVNNDCIDVNECRESGLLCRNGHCRNTPGSFRCECSSGYTLTPDGRNCRDIDECEETDNPCGHEGDPHCTNTAGGFECTCGPGWRLAGKRCVDRDECREKIGICAGGTCTNLPGGFKCTCPPGWVYNTPSSVCVDDRKELCYDTFSDDRCHDARFNVKLSKPECCCSEGAAWGKYCEPCPARGTADFKKICQGGIGRPNLTEDLDECIVRPGLCHGGTCINTDGSFRCSCPDGYALDRTGLACVDRDECVEEPFVCGNGTCTNTLGAYECSCHRGFAPGPLQTCEDVNECLELGAACAFRCHNTPGSYRCTCPYGYMLAADGIHCEDVDECNTPANSCQHKCKNTIGSFICLCPDGFRQVGEECEDVNECETDRERCANGVCINADGGWSCDCDPGFEPETDGHSCLDRRGGTCFKTLVGGRCQQSPWPARASLPYSPNSPQVTKAGCCCSMGAAWGPDCELCPAPDTIEYGDLCGRNAGKGFNKTGGDIDECATISDLCAPGRCLNTLGSFRCVCPRGFRASGDLCVDVDECLSSKSPCSHLCRNTRGSYTCNCRAGYELGDDGATCLDVDECARGVHTCQQDCKNTEGSYECSCREGFERRGDACVDVNECTTGEVCPSPGKCVNLLGSYRCVCPRGFRLDSTATYCLDRDECAEDGRCESTCRNYGGGYRCECPEGTTRAGGGCVPVDACAGAPCGAEPCFALGGSYRCGCPSGYGFEASHRVCIQQAGGCAASSCFFGCTALGGDGYQCGCPAGYRVVGQGHCLSTLDGSGIGYSPDDIGNAPVFPVQDEYRTNTGADLISTEGCFSCKVNGRRRRAPDEAVLFANGTTVLTRRRRRERRPRSGRRRSARSAEAELVVVEATPRQTWRRAPLLRLMPASAPPSASAVYRIVYGDPDRDFILGRRNGAWALRLRRRLKPDSSLERQLELEARVRPMTAGKQAGNRRRARRARRAAAQELAPLRLYVSVRIAPHAPA